MGFRPHAIAIWPTITICHVNAFRGTSPNSDLNQDYSVCDRGTPKPMLLFILDEAKHSENSHQHLLDEGTPSQTFSSAADKLFHMYKAQTQHRLPLQFYPTCLNKCHGIFLPLKRHICSSVYKVLPLTLTIATKIKIS